MLTITLKDVLNARQALQRIAGQAGIGAGMTLTLARVIRVCDAELETYSQTLQQLQEQHVQRDKESKPIVHDNVYEMRDRLAFDRAHQAMLAQSIELPIGRIKLSTFEREKALPTAAEAAALWWLISDLSSEGGNSEVKMLFEEEAE
jgi:hypothetical protein